MLIQEERFIQTSTDLIIKDNLESLVELEGLEARLHVNPIYKEQGYPAASSKVLVRQGVADRLVKVAKALPHDVNLVVWDGHRSFELQRAIYDNYVERLAVEFPRLSLERLQLLALDYVERPSKNVLHPTSHLTGGSVSVSLCTPFGEPLPMPTAFETYNAESHVKFYVSELDERFYDYGVYRDILVAAMVAEGFASYEKTWWRFDYGNQTWAFNKGIDTAKYGLIE